MFGITTRWFFGMVMGSAILSQAGCASAQSNIVPDNTLGAENSTVIPNFNGQPIEVISGGAQRGQNLFHSFREFNVSNGREAYFFSPGADIQNILARVTGSNRSEILGVLGTFGNSNPNLFLINPNGIIFGANASLNVGGSFVATTANAIGFGNQGFFSATNPNTPELLTVNPSALLFNQIAAAPIQNNSVADAGLNLSSEFKITGLRVPDGKSLLLVGGDIKIDGGGLYAFGGRVELGGVSGAGTVGLNGDGNNLSLSFPNSVERSDVFLSNGVIVAVIAGDGGSIAVNARNLEMTGGSFLLAGIESGLGSDNSRAGNIEVNATGAIINNGSLIANQVLAKANGQGGDVSISASTLRLEDGAQVNSSTFGSGKGGNLSVDAQNVQLTGTSADGFSSGLFASAERNSTGNAGDLTVKTNTLIVRDGARVGTNTFGSGNGGNLRVDAFDVQLIGESAYGLRPSGLFTDAQRNSTGNAGDLTVKTNTLLVRDGAQVGTDTFGSGKGGNLSVDALDVQLVGKSALNASAQPNSTGNAGDLTIKTNTLLVRDGAQVSTSTFGSGKGGDLTVDAQDVQLIGTSANDLLLSALSASAQLNSTGNAGDLTVKTNTLLVKDGAQVFTSTFGSGKGGSLRVDAQDVQLIGTSANDLLASGLNASAEPSSTGNAGDLTIKTNTLLVQNGAQVGAGTFGSGKGGNLRVDAQDVQLIGTSNDDQPRSGLFASAQPNSTGDAGDLIIKTNTLLVQDAVVAVESLGTGTAGNMTLNARSISLNNNALLTANTQSARVDPNREQATININSRDLIMRRGSNIRTNATGENVIGGNINIDTDFLVALENSDISANSANFRGGNVRINARQIFGTQFRDVASDRTSDITATGASRELSGTVELNAPDIDPDSGLVNLPTVPLDTELAQGCYSSGQANSRFTITGRGGLPLNPREAFNNNDTVRVDWVTLNPSSDNRKSQPVIIKQTDATPKPIVEATGWVINANGVVELVANAPTTTPHGSWQASANCGKPKI